MEKINSLPNLRQIYPFNDDDDDRLSLQGKLYRSSRPDLLHEVDLQKLDKLGIRSIIDFRSITEYRKASGHKRIDDMFQVMKVKVPRKFSYDQSETVKSISVYNNIRNRKHYLIDFFRSNYIWTIFNRAPWYIQLYSIIYLLVDLIFNTGFKYFVRVFARNVLNQRGLLGQYIDMIEMSQASICAALKLLTDENNIPSLLNCAHGKDRTGIVTALVLNCLGKSHSYIARDYAISEVSLADFKQRLHKEIVERMHMNKEFVYAREETMLGLLQYIEKQYGSIESYLSCIGFGPKDQQKLKQNIMDL